MSSVFRTGVLVGGHFHQVRPLNLVGFVEQTLERLQPHLPEAQRGKGVYVCVLLRGDGIPGVPVFHNAIGLVRAEKMQQHYDQSDKKARGMLDNPDHVLSWQHQDETREDFPGAAACYARSIGTSGLDSEADEVIAIELLVYEGCIDRDTADSYAEISNNKYYRLLNAA